jgi:Phage integrase family
VVPLPGIEAICKVPPSASRWSSIGQPIAANGGADIEAGSIIDDLDGKLNPCLPVRAEARLPRIRLHDLRHTAATLMLGQGEHPKIVSEMLGHSTIAVTLDLYSRVTPTMQRQAVDRLGVLLSRPRP